MGEDTRFFGIDPDPGVVRTAVDEMSRHLSSNRDPLGSGVSTGQVYEASDSAHFQLGDGGFAEAGMRRYVVLTLGVLLDVREILGDDFAGGTGSHDSALIEPDRPFAQLLDVVQVV